MTEIVMPRLSDSMEEGTVVQWLKQVGDEVAVGDELVEIETDKATMVYEADAAGTLVEIVAQEGETLPIGAVIARVGDPAEAADNGGAPEIDRAAEAPADALAAPAETAGVASPRAAPVAAPPAPQRADGDGRVKASPLARRMAASQGIDLTGLAGSGPGGRVVKADIEAALASGSAPNPEVGSTSSPAQAGVDASPRVSTPPASGQVPAPAGPGEGVGTAKGETEIFELTKLQQVVTRRMAESKATAPHFYLEAEVDMSAAVAARKGLKEIAREGEAVPTYNDMVVKACAIALREFPRANGAYRDGKIEHYSRVNVGVAVAAREALVVATVFDADLKGLRQISAETRALAARVRDGSVTPPELSGGTFTVSNLGMYGISNFAAVINPPQAGILAVGELKAKPVVASDGSFEARELMGVNLACDHRILYGADGALFLRRIRELLEEPIGLAL